MLTAHHPSRVGHESDTHTHATALASRQTLPLESIDYIILLCVAELAQQLALFLCAGGHLVEVLS